MKWKKVRESPCYRVTNGLHHMAGRRVELPGDIEFFTPQHLLIGCTAVLGETKLTYDFESRVTTIVGPGVNQTNTYNGLDTRVSKIDSLGTQTFHRDGAYVTDPVLRDGLANFTPGVSERRASVTTYSHSNLKSMDG